ncbi:MAG: helix-turn-helix transcriptional regulator [Ectothiorhodospiraceae bacterium]|nr:helix-turn-helix transcriptional regulator [Ectothiorhodospiraceae bacterium]MCH8503233.1 helix-turn-helix transcriptional regulator [Ectothiorhodospiraceae bacterium]
MVRKRLDDSHCAVARALNEVGDWWSLMIVLQAMYGVRRFSDFQQALGIAKNILCDRLARLVEHQVLAKVAVGEQGSRHEYRLTPKGRDLFTVVVALRQWSDRWHPDSRSPGMHDRAEGQPLQELYVSSSDGRRLDVRDVILQPADARKDTA